MSNEEEIFDSQLEREVAERLTKDGYTVVAHPTQEELPFDLGRYRPDLLATKPGENVIVEVKGSARSLPADRFREIADETAKHPGWRFLLVTGSDPEGVGEQRLLSWQQLREKLQHARGLLGAGETDAAFLLLWSCLEAAMRLQAQRSRLAIERFPTSTLVKQLYSNGELSMSQFDRALAHLALRNQAAHGFATENIGLAAEQLIGLTEELVEDWASGKEADVDPMHEPEGG